MPDLTKQHLVELAESKLQDAKLLLAGGRAGNAYYLAGYAVELMLKAILSTNIRAETIPSRELMRDIFTHDFDKLVGLARLTDARKRKADDAPAFLANWQIVLQWDEGSRYDVRGADAAKETDRCDRRPRSWSSSMVESATVTGELATVNRVVELLEQDGFRLDAAVWVPDDEGHGRLYLVPSARDENHLRQMIRVATTISDHKDELPDRHDLRYSVVDLDHAVIRAVRSVSKSPGKIRGIYQDGTYIDTAYVLRTAA